MSAESMKHEYRNDATEFLKQQEQARKTAFNLYLSEIIKMIDKCGGLIHNGNFNLFTRTETGTGKRVVYFYQSWLPYNAEDEKQFNAAVELYSEDGWTELEDIANWADVAADQVAEMKKDKKGMTADEILNYVRRLACSQGFYGRLYEQLRANKEALDYLVEQKFSEGLELVLFLEQ